MQGLNPLTMQCTYSTPCGWCTKWDKKCDKKIGPEVMPILKMPDHVAENIIEDVKNRVYESCGVSENLIENGNSFETINKAIDEIQLLENVIETTKHPDIDYVRFRKSVCAYCPDLNCMRSQVEICDCHKFKSYYEIEENK